MALAPKPPILVVDDFAPMRRIYRHFLKQIGLRDVDAAASGGEALAMLERRPYAAVISDWHMEPMTGFQLLQSVRADRSYAGLAFIMATVEARPEHVRAAQRAGASDYILKPFTVATLRSALANACPKIAAAMEPPIFTVPARERAARFRNLIEANARTARALPADDRVVEIFAGSMA